MFKEWPKIPRLSNEKESYAEKLDGTNACVIITYENSDVKPIAIYLTEIGEARIYAQSRSKLIYPGSDNFGFAKWVSENLDTVIKLGEGYHYGEWWGQGIQRGYGLKDKRFSLFNYARWNSDNPPPEGIYVVPQIKASSVEEAVEVLKNNGSLASPGFMRVEGIVVYKHLTKSYYKVIVDK